MHTYTYNTTKDERSSTFGAIIYKDGKVTIANGDLLTETLAREWAEKYIADEQYRDGMADMSEDDRIEALFGGEYDPSYEEWNQPGQAEATKADETAEAEKAQQIAEELGVVAVSDTDTDTLAAMGCTRELVNAGVDYEDATSSHPTMDRAWCKSGRRLRKWCGYYMVPRDELIEVMTVAEVAETYGVTRDAVNKAINGRDRQHIPARQSGSTWLIRRADAKARWGSKCQTKLVPYEDGSATLYTQNVQEGKAYYYAQEQYPDGVQGDIYEVTEQDWLAAGKS